MDRMTIGAALRNARGEHTQTDIAERLGVGQNTVSDWERDRSLPGLDQITAFDQACGRPRGWTLRVAGYVDELVDVPTAVASDPALDDVGRTVIVDLYRIWVERADGARKRPRHRS